MLLCNKHVMPVYGAIFTRNMLCAMCCASWICVLPLWKCVMLLLLLTVVFEYLGPPGCWQSGVWLEHSCRGTLLSVVPEAVGLLGQSVQKTRRLKCWLLLWVTALGGGRRVRQSLLRWGNSMTLDPVWMKKEIKMGLQLCPPRWAGINRRLHSCRIWEETGAFWCPAAQRGHSQH